MTEPVAISHGSVTRRPRRLAVVVGLLAGVLLVGAVVLVVTMYPTSTPELAGVDRIVPTAAPPAAPPVVVSPSTSAVAAPSPKPCAGVSQFRQVLETTAPGFAARRGITVLDEGL